MKTLGVVLAGGRSTRLNNKILLPQKNLRPVIFNSIDYLIGNGIQNIIVLDKQESVLPKMLYCLNTLSYVNVTIIKDNFDGIIPCLSSLARTVKQETDCDGLYIVCADNVYPSGEVIEYKPNAVVCRYTPPEVSKHLVGYTGKRWVSAGTDASKPLISLTTPWFFQCESVCRTKAEDVPSLLNELDVDIIIKSDYDWADLGTEETFLRYWNA